MNDEDARLARIESELGELKEEIKEEVKEIKGMFVQVFQALAKIDGRLDEQGHTLNALIPTRLAAVGDR